MAQQAQQPGIAARAHVALAAEHNDQPLTAKTLLKDALGHLRQAESSHDTAYELIFIGRAYHRLAATDPPLVLRAAEVFTEAAMLAQTLQTHGLCPTPGGIWDASTKRNAATRRL